MKKGYFTFLNNKTQNYMDTTTENKPTLSQCALNLVEAFENQIELGYVTSHVSGIDTKTAAKHCAIMSLENTTKSMRTYSEQIILKGVDMAVIQEAMHAKMKENEQLISILKEMDFGGL